MTNTAERQVYRVSYIHMRGYRVARTFDTPEAAQEFIDVNAMIYPLPGVRVEPECPTCESTTHAKHHYSGSDLT